jgi:hypothetical protein
VLAAPQGEPVLAITKDGKRVDHRLRVVHATPRRVVDPDPSPRLVEPVEARQTDIDQRVTAWVPVGGHAPTTATVGTSRWTQAPDPRDPGALALAIIPDMDQPRRLVSRCRSPAKRSATPQVPRSSAILHAVTGEDVAASRSEICSTRSAWPARDDARRRPHTAAFPAWSTYGNLARFRLLYLNGGSRHADRPRDWVLLARPHTEPRPTALPGGSNRNGDL